MKILENTSLRPYNTFGINALSRYFTQAGSLDELNEALDFAKEKCPLMVLGGGSNLLLTKDYEGLVLKNDFRGIEKIGEDEEYVYVKSYAGEVWHQFVLHCIDNQYAGVENLSLIPGSVGAAPMQNIGAYGVELKNVFHELEAFHKQERVVEVFNKSACDFGYRESVFKRKYKDEFVILSVTFKLSKNPQFNTSYGAIEQELAQMNVKDVSIKAISDAVIRIRQSKLPDPAKIGNAGSFFKNPVVSSEKYHKLKREHPDLVAYPSGESFKLAAGWLIEQAGWKGKTINDNYGVHKNQALVLVNYGGAKGSEIYQLSEDIISSVHGKYGVVLEREVNIV
jgi:UDP-N-acetylmuramate dehydrogenase